MIYVCNDGSYGIIATSQNEGRESKIIRIKPIDDASILSLSYKDLRYQRPSWTIALRIIIVIIYFGLLIWFISSSGTLKNPATEATISFALIVIVIAILAIVFRYRRSAYLSPTQACSKVENWQKISSVRYIGKRRMGFTDLNIISLTINNEDYIVNLSNKELERLKQIGIIL